MDKVTIIGIAGGTGSGKTTVVKKIVEALPPHYVAVVPLDSYYNDTSHMTEEERKAINFDHPDAFDWNCSSSRSTNCDKAMPSSNRPILTFFPTDFPTPFTLSPSRSSSSKAS